MTEPYTLLPDWLPALMDELNLDAAEKDVLIRLASDYDYGLIAPAERSELLLTAARLGSAWQEQSAPGRPPPRSLVTADFLSTTGIGRLLRPFKRQTPRYLGYDV